MHLSRGPVTPSPTHTLCARPGQRLLSARGPCDFGRAPVGAFAQVLSPVSGPLRTARSTWPPPTPPRQGHPQSPDVGCGRPSPAPPAETLPVLPRLSQTPHPEGRWPWPGPFSCSSVAPGPSPRSRRPSWVAGQPRRPPEGQWGPFSRPWAPGGPGVTAEVGQKRESSPPRALELWRLSLLSEGPEPQPGSSRVAR